MKGSTMMPITGSTEASSKLQHALHVLGLISAALAAGCGLIVLVGWVADLPLLTSFFADGTPMAPSTALIFLLYAAATFFHALWPRIAIARRMGVALGLSGMGVSLLLLALSFSGMHPAAEHLGMRIVGTANGAPIGHISPLTAICFAVAGASFLALLLSSPGRAGWAITALCLASIVVLASVLLILAYIFGSALLHASNYILPSLPTSLALLMLGASLGASSAERTWSLGATATVPHDRSAYALASIVVLLAAGIATVGYVYNRNYQEDYRTQIDRQLSAIADLKVVDLACWRQERIGDAASVFRNPAFFALGRRYLQEPLDTEAHRLLQAWMGRLQTELQYDRVVLLDTQRVVRIAVPDTAEPADLHLTEAVAETLRSGKLAFVDFYRNTPDGPIYLAVMVPIIDEQDAAGPIGVLVLRINPAIHLYPFIQRWPTPTQTAETLLIRRDGNDAVFLNELKFRKGSALSLRVPITRIAVPAVKAACGQEGIVNGLDYRGEPVVAAIRAVPDSPWFLVARMDMAEAYAPLMNRLWPIVALASSMLLIAGLSIILIWRRKRLQFYMEKAEITRVLLASEVQYRRLFEAAHDGILIVDAQTGKVMDVNPFLVNLLGLSREYFLTRTLWELGFSSDAIANGANFVELQQKGYIRYEDMPLETVDGRSIDVEFVSNIYEVNGSKVIQCNIRDISARTLTQRKLARVIARLARSNKELESFAYAASHDLRGPLITITGFAGRLAADIEQGDVKAAHSDLARIGEAATKMDRLLHDLLQLSRVGHLVGSTEDVSLTELALEVVKLLAGPIADGRARIEISPDLPTVHGERARLTQLLVNLLDNAVKFIREQPDPQVKIGVRRDGEETVCYVRDNGIGIDMQHKDRIFVLFHQLDPNRGGTGIGLAIAKRVVEMHGGRIWVESDGLGNGSAFCFTLVGVADPCIDEEQDNGQRHAARIAG